MQCPARQKPVPYFLKYVLCEVQLFFNEPATKERGNAAQYDDLNTGN